jgi:CRISPR-associated protein Csd1
MRRWPRRAAIARPGWGKTKIAFALELDEDGKLVRALPLSSPSPDGKKPVPRTMELPAPVKRTVGIAANFLWDNSAYLLGIGRKGQTGTRKGLLRRREGAAFVAAVGA